MHRCVICDKEIRATWICAKCRREYNVPAKFADWPAWLKAIKELEQVQRNEDAHIAAYIDPTDARYYDDEDGGRHTHALPMTI